MNGEESGETNDPVSRELLLPPKSDEGEYVLEFWKVKDGSLVREGETVAIACLKGTNNNGSSEGAANAAAAAAATTGPTDTKHRRPTRRKRPTPATAPKADLQQSPKPARETPEGSVIEVKNMIKLPSKEHQKKNAQENGLSKTESTDAMDTESKTSSESSSRKQQQSINIVAPIAGFVRIGKKLNTKEQTNDRAAIGVVEPCEHPAVVDGLCGVCGVPLVQEDSADDNGVAGTSSSPGGSSKAMSQITVSGGLTFKVSEQEGQQMARQSAQKLRKQRKLSLILDLDHTLVHATADMRARQHLDTREDVRSLVLPIVEETEQGQRHLWMQHFVKLRPNIKEFINEVLPLYETGVYTAGTRQYAEQIAIVLCRHVVGAEKDQIDLDQLKYQVSQAEEEFRQSQADIEATKTQELSDTKMNVDSPNNIQKDNKRQHSGEEEHGEGDDKDKEDDEPKKKKRKVTFAAEPPPETQLPESKIVTQEDVDRLKKELEEAERLENEAIELRQRLFGSRIVSRTDVGDLGRDVKSLKRIFPCGGTMAAVVDDREDVWANARDNNNGSDSNGSNRKGEPPDNLLLVRPYHWEPFVGFADINNASGIDLAAEADGNKSARDTTSETDVQLLWTADTLKRLHARYYDCSSDSELEEKTVPQLLSDMRREVLQGDKIVLSGLIPLHRQSQDGSYMGPRPSIVRYAESLGTAVRLLVCIRAAWDRSKACR